jgi:tetratricopeptide (TPR) repeat protein
MIRFVDPDTDGEVARLTPREAAFYNPQCFTPDVTQLLAISADHKAIDVWDLRAIRQQLKRMDLDWKWPEFGPAEPKVPAAQFVKVEVLSGDLRLTREQRARQAIDHYRHEVKVNPNNALACNGLAWAYLIGPMELRDVKAALPLAENAVRLAASNTYFLNTLGVAYYRAGRYPEAVKVLRANLDNQVDKILAFDLYFLAMSHHRMGAVARARDYFDWAVRWVHTQPNLDAAHVDELTEIRSEAEVLLGTDKK